MDDLIGQHVLTSLNQIAGLVNGTYDSVNFRRATTATVKAAVALMRSELELIETQLWNEEVVLKSVPDL